MESLLALQALHMPALGEVAWFANAVPAEGVSGVIAVDLKCSGIQELGKMIPQAICGQLIGWHLASCYPCHTALTHRTWL